MSAGEVGQTPVVMKFGGSSVADLERLQDVARRVVERAEREPVVVVVSAMGKTTNRLLDDARHLLDPPPARELDMLLTTGERQSMALLAVAIAGHGRRAMSLTGSQCGIITDHQHGRARIVEVRPFRILDELAAGHIVIVGGFQGVSYKREVTTLGRGGSDTTAVALAAALGADCEIYSDVDGVYSADPREVPDARRIDELSYEEMQALSRAGAKVLHAQAVELAQEREIAIYARKTTGGDGETVIRKDARRAPGVRAVTSDADVSRLRIDVASDGWRWPAGAAARIGSLGLRYLAVDGDGARGILGSQRTDRAEVVDTLRRVAADLDTDASVDVREGDALVSCVGAGLEDRPELTGQALEALEAQDIAALEIHTDAQSLAFVVPEAKRSRAVAALHGRFVGSAVRAVVGLMLLAAGNAGCVLAFHDDDEVTDDGSGTSGTESGSGSGSGSGTDGGGETSGTFACGWGETGDVNVPIGYVCGGDGPDPSGETALQCPPGLEVDAPCGTVTGAGCCDADGNVWYCAGETLFQQLCG